jgi:DedD protein
MDRALKERVIGAIVIVIFAVLVVPVFLDGSSDDATFISEAVTLPGQNDQGTRQQTVVLKRDRTQPVPQSQFEVKEDPPPQSQEEVRSDPPPQSKSPAETTPKAPAKAPDATLSKSTEAKPASATSSGMWAVQMGSFSEKVNAEGLVADLKKDGFAAFLSQLNTSSGDLHRVRIGPQKDRAGAESIAAQLQKAGHKGQVVTHP